MSGLTQFSIPLGDSDLKQVGCTTMLELHMTSAAGAVRLGVGWLQASWGQQEQKSKQNAGHL